MATAPLSHPLSKYYIKDKTDGLVIIDGVLLVSQPPTTVFLWLSGLANASQVTKTGKIVIKYFASCDNQH